MDVRTTVLRRVGAGRAAGRVEDAAVGGRTLGQHVDVVGEQATLGAIDVVHATQQKGLTLSDAQALIERIWHVLA